MRHRCSSIQHGWFVHGDSPPRGAFIYARNFPAACGARRNMEPTCLVCEHVHTLETFDVHARFSIPPQPPSVARATPSAHAVPYVTRPEGLDSSLWVTTTLLCTGNARSTTRHHREAAALFSVRPRTRRPPLARAARRCSVRLWCPHLATDLRGDLIVRQACGGEQWDLLATRDGVHHVDGADARLNHLLRVRALRRIDGRALRRPRTTDRERQRHADFPIQHRPPRCTNDALCRFFLSHTPGCRGMPPAARAGHHRWAFPTR